MKDQKVSFLILVLLGIISSLNAAEPVKVDVRPESSKENFHFFVLSDTCFKMLSEKYTLDIPCLKLTISKLVGLALVTFSIILKVPQILKIVKSQSSEGLSYFGFFVELLTYTFSFGYNFHYQNPFSTYGENVFLMIQGIIILFLIKTYGKDLSWITFWLSQIFYLVFFCVLVIDIVPEQVHQLSLVINIMFVVASRSPQILLNFQNKSTGQLSFITIFLSFGGCIARIFTLLVEVKDMLLMALMVIAAILNGILVFQFIIYWHSKTKTTKKD